MATASERITYRLRRCPLDADAKRCAILLSLAFPDIQPEAVRIRSLAPSLNPWERPHTKVATLTFQITPASLTGQLDQNEWVLPIQELESPLILDTHFLGLTPLNEVVVRTHEVDCIAISGLASHPFGSWQPKGEDKSFMWLRDELPRTMPGSRSILYGYDTTLVNSKSFQTIADLASSLVNLIKANGWHLSNSKPLVFLAHSLGGIILKEAFSMMAIGDDQGRHILDRFLGGIFFGVPSHGMKTSHLLAMVRGQVNEQVVSDLSTDSEYLGVLDDSFSGLVLTRHMRLYWAYETKTSPTIKKHQDGHYSRSGPEDILVTKDSATRKSHHLRTPATFPVNESHSDMVKFRQDDPNLLIVLSKLRDINEYGRPPRANGDQRMDGPNYASYLTARRSIGLEEGRIDRIKDWHLHGDLRERVIADLIHSIEIPGRDDRLDTIDEAFSHTFKWIFDKNSAFLRWLEEGAGMFWIHGKPASGKSTLMKFIYQSWRTSELLYKFSSDTIQVKAAFFFHDRGVSLQKSFEGLLRSILHQILVGNRGRLRLAVARKVASERQSTNFKSQDWSVHELESCIRFILQQTEVKLDLFFMLDALDEYDGDPEFVCKFLKSLADVMENSPNTLKILFSSRPWDIFKQHFGNLQSLQLQEYTKEDIREYCLGFVESESEDISAALSRLTSVVIERANGVFLWVKLVLRELVAEAAKGRRDHELSRVLDAIPDDLGHYYTRIIQRIPEKFRWESYVIFEALTTKRSSRDDILDLLELVLIISCSQSSTYSEARQNFAALHPRPSRGKPDTPGAAERGFFTHLLRGVVSKSPSNDVRDSGCEYYPGSAWVRRHESRILTMTGGLVEFVKLSRLRDFPTVQLVHQTVREFSNGHDFKRVMFGNKAKTIHDSGDSFFARYYLAGGSTWWRCAGDWRDGGRHLQRYEYASGRSLKRLIDSVPNHVFLRESKEHAPGQSSITGPLGFAALNNLQIYLEETVQANPMAFRETKELLLRRPDHILRFGAVEYAHADAAFLKFIFDSGYTFMQDPKALKLTMICIVDIENDPGNLVPTERDTRYLLEDRAAVFIRHGAPASTSIKVSKEYGVHYRMGRKSIQLMHLANTIELIDCLVENGVDVNTPDSSGDVPLDHAFKQLLYAGAKGEYRGRQKEAAKYWYFQRISHLIELGGITKNTSKEVWKEYLTPIERLGFDRSLAQDCFRRLFPDIGA
ncbi:hypothetical protein F5Y10DRAFT_243740 [Nemania abortiva]|nr:hypothetical protein F5Y10DRAFT_243740 [Nemania abortiva]